MRRLPPLLAFGLLIVLILALTGLGPRERTLGVNVRMVYLHGAWVWTALVGFAAAGVAGAVGLATRRPALQRWSVALGQAATCFWVTYLPMSLWVMQANWNGLFLQEPRWRVGLDFAIVALLLQAATLVLGRPDWGSAVNIAFLGALTFSLSRAQQVMHPPSPIAASGSLAIEGFFASMVAACLLAAWQLVRWLRQRTA